MWQIELDLICRYTLSEDHILQPTHKPSDQILNRQLKRVFLDISVQRNAIQIKNHQ